MDLKFSLTNFHGLKLQHLHIVDVPICVKDNPRVLLFQFSRVSRANRYMLFCGPMFVPAFVLSQPNFKVK